MFMKKFEAEQFKPLIEEMAKQFQDKLWEDVADYLLYDTESNLQSEMQRMVENTVKSLLSGEDWALKRYTLGSKYDCEKIRKTIAAHIPKELQDKRIEDLEEENEQLKDDIKLYKYR